MHLRNGSTDKYTFIESRRELYSGNISQYPMYFKGKHSQLNFKHSSSLDTTYYIKSTISQAIKNPDRASNKIKSSEINRLLAQQSYIKSEFEDKPFAATYTVYESSKINPKPQEPRFFGNISSRLFVDHYSSVHDLIVPTGIFNDPHLEDFDLYPLFDLKINRILFEKLGMAAVIFDPDFHQPYLTLISDECFGEFSKARMAFIKALTEAAGRTVGDTEAAAYKIIASLNEIDFGSFPSGQPQTALLLIQRLNSIARRLSETNKEFAKAMENIVENANHEDPIVIFTATDLEDEMLKAGAIAHGYQFVELKAMRGFSAAIYRNKSHGIFWHVRSSAGSSGTHGSARVSQLVIEQIRPYFIIAAGIAFGVDESKQSLGDVLVSEYIFTYEMVKISEGTIKWRGDKIPCNGDVISFSRQFSHLESGFKVIVGGILSGDKLVNDAQFRAALTNLDEKSVGGEMEAAGLAQSCSAGGIQFAMIKGICDFAVGKDDKAQKPAATNAFKVTFKLLDSILLAYSRKR